MTINIFVYPSLANMINLSFLLIINYELSSNFNNNTGCLVSRHILFDHFNTIICSCYILLYLHSIIEILVMAQGCNNNIISISIT